jgi:hypothetical protein
MTGTRRGGATARDILQSRTNQKHATRHPPLMSPPLDPAQLPLQLALLRTTTPAQELFIGQR